MQIDGYIQALREDLIRVASLGDETTSRAAELLSVAIEASLGASVNTWLVQALQRSVESKSHRSISSGSRNRLTGYGRS